MSGSVSIAEQGEDCVSLRVQHRLTESTIKCLIPGMVPVAMMVE